MNSATLFDLARTKPLETIVEHEIQIRAYELYEQRGKGTGFALQDWLRQRPKFWQNAIRRRIHEGLHLPSLVVVSLTRSVLEIRNVTPGPDAQAIN